MSYVSSAYTIGSLTSILRRYVMVRNARQLIIQLTTVLVSLFYTCAVLELDLGETGDSFGDVFDTYVLSKTVQSPKPTENLSRTILPGLAVIAPNYRPICLSLDWSIVLALPVLAFHVNKKLLTHRRLQAMYAIWRL